MKVKIKQPKKKLAFYSVLIILLIALVSVIFLLNTKNQDIKLNRYNEIVENCVMDDKNSKTLLFNCTALLNDFEFIENKGECFSLSLVSSQDRLVDLSICEKEGIVEWDKQTMINEDRLIPIYITLEYDKTILDSYDLNSLLFTIIEDSEITDLQNRLAQNGVQLPRVRTEIEQALIDRGYYPNPPLEVIAGEKFERVTFYLGNVQSVSKKGDGLLVDLRINIGGRDYKTTFEAKSFSYMRNWDYFEKVTPSNIDDYTIEGEHQIVLLYLDSGSKISIDDLRQFCLKEDKSFNALPVCNNIEGLSLDSLKIDDIDNYIENIDKESKEGFLEFDDFVFGYLIKK